MIDEIARAARTESEIFDAVEPPGKNQRKLVCYGRNVSRRSLMQRCSEQQCSLTRISHCDLCKQDTHGINFSISVRSGFVTNFLQSDNIEAIPSFNWGITAHPGPVVANERHVTQCRVISLFDSL